MLCFNCGASNWENIDQYRLKKVGMSICTCCGAISYPSKWKSEDEIKKHYRNSYRTPPTHNNIFAGERKNHFHHAFLNDLFTEWKSENKKPVICESGAAFGMALNFFKQVFPEAELHGTEITTSFRRNAFHEFGIKLTEDFDMTRKYDLIMSYKVLEHQLDPRRELTKFRTCLADDGFLYISVPTWFNSMINFGQSGFDLEYYYDPNHVNVWTRPMFEVMLKSCGFEIVKEDHIIYADTYLCKKSDNFSTQEYHKENIDEIKSHLQKTYDAYFLMLDNKFKEAIQVWPDFPQAWINHLEFSRKELAEGWESFKEKYVEPMIAACPLSPEVLITACDFAMRGKNWQDAISYCEKALRAKPENPNSLYHMTNIMREIAIESKDIETKTHYFLQAREVAKHLRKTSLQYFKEATDLIMLYNAQLKFKDE